jgi:hypothetical protein
VFRARTELGIESAAALEQVKVRESEYKRGEQAGFHSANRRVSAL